MTEKELAAKLYEAWTTSPLSRQKSKLGDFDGLGPIDQIRWINVAREVKAFLKDEFIFNGIFRQ